MNASKSQFNRFFSIKSFEYETHLIVDFYAGEILVLSPIFILFKLVLIISLFSFLFR